MQHRLALILRSSRPQLYIPDDSCMQYCAMCVATMPCAAQATTVVGSVVHSSVKPYAGLPYGSGGVLET